MGSTENSVDPERRITIASVNPGPDAKDVEINIEPTIKFTKDIDPWSVSEVTVKISPPVPNTVFVHPMESDTVVLSPDSDLNEETDYTVTVTTGIKAKESEVHLETAYAWRFQTGTHEKTDNTKPIVMSTYPTKPHSQGVSTSTSIEIVFSKRMDPRTINQENIKLLDSRMVEVLADISLAPDRRTVKINPIGPLDENKTYGVRFTGGVKDANKIAVDPGQYLRFSTGSTSSSQYENYNEEWKMCRQTTDKFDATLLDLRKYGFTIVTGLITAGAFLGFSDPTAVIQIGVIIVSMALVVILYWLDVYYMNLLYGSVFRTRFLELFRLKRGLSIYISVFYTATRIGAVLHSLYIGFLISLVILGMYVLSTTTYGSAPIPETNKTLATSTLNVTSSMREGAVAINTTKLVPARQNGTIVGLPWVMVDTMDNNKLRAGILIFEASPYTVGLYGASAVSILVIGLIWYFCNHGRKHTIKQFTEMFDEALKSVNQMRDENQFKGRVDDLERRILKTFKGRY